jgi:uncharacterized protein YbbK (DUF523 family)
MENCDVKLSIPVGVSACLLGHKVRYDGGHKRSKYCLNVLSECFDLKPFCPEVAIGLTTPREPIRLVGSAEAPRVVGVKDPSLDVTDRLADYADQVSQAEQDLCRRARVKGWYERCAQVPLLIVSQNT